MSALDVLSGLVLEDGRRWGEVATDWQWQDAEAILDGDSATPYSFLTRARGGSKTSDLAAITLSAMLAQLPAGARCYGLAADRDQGALLVQAVEGFARRTPELAGALTIGPYRVTASRSGSSLDVLPADAASSWGIRPSFVIVDELAQWASTPGPRRLFESVASSVAKVAAARLTVITTSGDVAHWSRKVLDHALSDPLWRVHEVPGPPPWLDQERLAEQRRRLPESLYRRLFENEWTASEDRLAAPDDLAACVTLDGPLDPVPGRPYVIGLDVGLKRDRTVCVVAHGEPVVVTEFGVGQVTRGTRVVLDRIEVWEGTTARPVELRLVEEWVEQAVARYGNARLVLDPWQAVGMLQRLRGRGVRVEEYAFTQRSVAKLALTLLDLIRSRRLALPDDPDLLDELANVRLRESAPGVYRLDHDADGHDDRAVALALAAQAITGRPDGSRLHADFDVEGSIRDDLDPDRHPVAYGMVL